MEWHYLNNQFDNATQGSFRLMLTVTNDHFAKLLAQQADPDILNLLNRTAPVHDLFLDSYSKWKVEQGAYKGATQLVDELLNTLLSETARQWNTAIMVVYDKGTVEHTALLPNGQAPFQGGTIDERVAAVKSLSENLSGYAPLVALQGTVAAFHAQLKDARDTQQGKEQLTGQRSTDLELAREAIALMQYRNLGMLMDKFGDQPEQVLNYFELQLIQSGSGDQPGSEEFIGTVAPASTVNITSNIASDATVIITNTGSVSLRFCAAPDAVTACAAGLDVPAGTVTQAKAGDFIDPANPFFNVTNDDAAMEGSYSVEVVQAV